jgi:TusA-related sulfurtransferase
MMYDFNHIRVEELMEKLSKLPPGTRLSVQFDDETIRKAMERTSAHEAIERLEGSGNGKLYDRLMEDRSSERARER